MKVKIYCLYDPLECKIRYIGRTKKKVLEHRLLEHISKSKYFERYYPGKRKTYKVNWINKLLNEGREPKIKYLTSIEGWSESHKFERNLINLWSATKLSNNKYQDKYKEENGDPFEYAVRHKTGSA